MSLEKNQLVIFGLILAVALVLGANAIGGAVRQLKASSFDVTGAASKVVASDQGVWSIEVKGHAATTGEAYQGLQRNMKLVREFLTKQGFKPEELSVDGVDKRTYYVRDHRGYTTNEPESYDVVQTIKVESQQVKLIQQVSTQLGTLMKQNVLFEARTPQYLFSRLDDMKIEMIGLATKNAKDRARQMAKSAGNRVGPLVTASTGVFQITPEYSTEVSDWGVNDTTTIRKKITAVVNVGFALE